MDRKFDLTTGPEYIDCDHHCPSAKLCEYTPNFQYDIKEKSTGTYMDGPFCNNLEAPLSGENEPRILLKKSDDGARRICVYWDELLSHTP